MKGRIARTSRGSIEYTLNGDGPVVLVCHGTSSDCFDTGLAEPFLEAGFAVLTPSRPGFGQTALEVGRTAAQAAAAMILLLDELRIDSCAVMGVSGGGPTGVALAAGNPLRVSRLILAAARTRTETHAAEPSYKDQMAFYGPLHAITWGTLGFMSRLSPQAIARQTMSIFSTHDPHDVMPRLSEYDIQTICRFYRGRSARQGALNDATHTVGAELLGQVCQPALVVHSREDRAVPFAHAEWSLKHIPQAELCEAGCTGHFFWVGPDAARIGERMVAFLQASEPLLTYQ